MLARAGKLTSVTLGNVAAAARYLKFWDAAVASAFAVGTDVPVYVVRVSATAVGGYTHLNLLPGGIQFKTGIAFALVTGIADSDDTAPSAADVTIDLTYTQG